MVLRAAILVLLLWSALAGSVPAPKDHLGYTPGDDYKLADYADIIGYFEKLTKSSDRIRLVEFGKTSFGKPMYVAFLSAPENLRKLDRYREISSRLARGKATPDEARQLAAEGKAIVWIDSGLHASEVAPAQQAPDLAYRVITGESDEARRIRQNVILMQVPCINPDGLDLIVHWYRKNVGTPYELASLTTLYQKYAGHDNNRDWFMLNLQETRNVTRLLFQEWFPQIVYNQHQSPAFPARIFVPPYAEPLNPNIPAPVMEGINLIGAAMKERFAREEKPGILSYYGFDAWWNGGLRSVPAFHNMHGILTETALYSYATPRDYRSSELPDRFPNGIPTREPSMFYQRPWLGGKWGVRDAIEYMLTADFAILDLASARPEQFLYKAWDVARANMELGKKGKPFAYVISTQQGDRFSAHEMLQRLEAAGIEVQRARSDFRAGNKTYPEGSFVLAAAQPFRPYLVDLMEPQIYPELRTGVTGPTKRPYDVAGWTLSMQMGVQVDRIEEPFAANLDTLAKVPAFEPVLDHRDNSSFLATAGILARGAPVRWGADGAILTNRGDAFDKAAFDLRKPRVAIYEPFSANADQGWTQWVFENFKIPYELIHNSDTHTANLRERFDTIVFAQQNADGILHGIRSGEFEGGSSSSARRVQSVQRPEYTGGIGSQGVANLEAFVRQGGTLIALSTATELPLQWFPLSIRNVLRPSGGQSPESDESSSRAPSFYSPGSLLRIIVDNTNPIGFGMPREAVAFSSGGQAFEISAIAEYNKGDREIRSVASYATGKLLASGWVSGERAVTGRHVVLEARHGQGRVVLYGIRPQHRGQSWGTFKLLLNAVYLGSAKTL